MLRNIPLILLVSASLVACGGSDNDKKNNSSSSAPASSAPASAAPSSTPASAAPSSTPASAAPSSTPASAAPSSAPASSAPAGPTVITADVTTGWRGNGPGNVGVSYIGDGVSFNAIANEVGAVFDVNPMNLQNAVLEMVLRVSPEFKASGANLQPFAQVKEVWAGKWCDIPNAALNASEDYAATCTLDAAVLNQTVNGYQVGVQANGTAPTGAVTIKSAKITLATQAASSSSMASSMAAASSSVASNVLTADLTQGWQNNGGAVSYPAAGVVYTPTAPAQYDANAYFTIAGPRNFEGATLTMVVVPDAAFTAAGYDIQPFAQLDGGSYAGDYHCVVDNEVLVADTDNTLTCTTASSTATPPLTAGTFNIADTTPVRFGVQTIGVTTHAGTLTIKSATVTLAP